MKNKIKCYMVSCMWLLTSIGNAQSDSINYINFPADWQEHMSTPDNAAIEIDLNLVSDKLNAFRNKPIDLNKAENEDLYHCGLFSARQIDDLIAWRSKTGAIMEMYELQAIPSFSVQDIKNLLPFITINSASQRSSTKDQLINANNLIRIRNFLVLEKSAGFEKQKYNGNRFSQMIQFRKQYNNQLSLSLNLEKDAGESYWYPPKIRFADFASFHVKLPIKKASLILGDYSASLGQGLILMQDFAPGKSPFITDLKRIPKVLKPYTSRGEAGFFRGLAASIPLSKSISLTLLNSMKRIDGNTIRDSLSEIQNISSLQVSGLHRTSAEIADKKSVFNLTLGSSIQVQKKNANLGFQIIYNWLDKPLQFEEKLYRQYSFSGKELLNYSLNYSYLHKNINFFGETGLSNNGGFGTVNGLLLSLDKNVQFSLIYRNYGRHFHTLNASSIAESSGNNNEKGLYWGCTMTPFSKIKIESFVDFWKNPWLKFQVDAPSSGYEYFSKVTYQQSRKLDFYLQYRFKKKEKSKVSASLLSHLHPIYTQQIRLHFSQQIIPDLKWQCRTEFSTYTFDSKSSGSMLYTDLNWKPKTIPLSISARYSIFSTTDYNSRMYAYENSFTGNYALTASAGKGTRYYVNLRYRAMKRTSIELRFARSYFPNATSIGSGNDMIPGNKKTEVGVQITIND
ncbi:MAG: hypothetical protein ACOYOA_11245 [Saprospiraceae bacterium]